MLRDIGRTLLPALCIAAALAAPALADNQLNCTVTDSAKNPVKGAELVLKAESGKEPGKTWSKKTNDKGEVEFKGVPDGSYVLLKTDSGSGKGMLLSNVGPLELSSGASPACSPVFVPVDKLNDLLTASNASRKAGNLEANQEKRDQLFDDAMAKGKEAVALAPTVPNSHLALALAYADKGMVDEAMAEAGKAASLDKKFEPIQAQVHLEALGAQGNAAMTKGDFDAAIKAFQQAQALAPNDGLSYYNLALAYGHKGNLDQAVQNIDKAAELSPNDASIKQVKDKLQDMYLKSTQQQLTK